MVAFNLQFALLRFFDGQDPRFAGLLGLIEQSHVDECTQNQGRDKAHEIGLLNQDEPSARFALASGFHASFVVSQKHLTDLRTLKGE